VPSRTPPHHFPSRILHSTEQGLSCDKSCHRCGPSLRSKQTLPSIGSIATIPPWHLIPSRSCPHFGYTENKHSFRSSSYILRVATGGELLDAVLERGSYSEATACACFAQLLEGVRYLHSHGVVHRDLKLENLLLEEKHDLSRIRIVDFGLAKGHYQVAAMSMELFAERRIMWHLRCSRCGSRILDSRHFLLFCLVSSSNIHLPDWQTSCLSTLNVNLIRHLISSTGAELSRSLFDQHN
jgi:serine/threonine protein kinase